MSDASAAASSYCRLLVVDHFDKLVNEIDLQTEKSLVSFLADDAAIINEKRSDFVQQAKEIELECLQCLDQVADSFNHQVSDLNLNDLAFPKFSFLFPKEDWSIENGSLVTTDGYTSPRQIELLALLIKHEGESTVDLESENEFFVLNNQKVLF
jgi:hypothetical protein